MTPVIRFIGVVVLVAIAAALKSNVLLPPLSHKPNPPLSIYRHLCIRFGFDWKTVYVPVCVRT